MDMGTVAGAMYWVLGTPAWCAYPISIGRLNVQRFTVLIIERTVGHNRQSGLFTTGLVYIGRE